MSFKSNMQQNMLLLVFYYGVILFTCILEDISVEGESQPARTRPDFCNEDREEDIDYNCFDQPKSYSFYPDTERCEEIPEGLCVTRRTFGTKQECVGGCVTGYYRDPSKILDICNVPRQERTRGACFNDWTIWAFYPDINRCAVLGFQGCMGDDYTFETEEECTTSCSSAMYANRPDFCNLPRIDNNNEERRDGCSTENSTWTFYPETGDCEMISHGGCLDHKNVFLDERECTITCIPGLLALEQSILEGQNEEETFYDKISDALDRIAEESKYGKEEISLNEDIKNITIQHPANGERYQPDERFEWIIRNDDPKAVGFRIDADYVSIEKCCDQLIIHRDTCHFPTPIKSSSDTPLFFPGAKINITFISDHMVTYYGFNITVSAMYSLWGIACPGIQRDLILHQDEKSLQIRHPDNGGNYKNNERYVWRIKNENAGAAGFEVTFEEIGVHKCCDKLRIIGEHCNYGTYTYVNKSPMTIRGDQLNITWISNSEYNDLGFILTVRSLEQLNKTDCYEYTCDGSGRCVRVHYDDYLNWYDSQAVCEAEGARLVVITDQGMDDLVRSAIDVNYSNPYIGLSGESADSMIWINRNTTSDYLYQNWDTKWHHVSSKPICGSYDPFDGWQSTHCYYEWPFVCEKL